MSDDERGMLGLPRGFRERTLVTARLATKLGAAAVKKQLGLEPGEPDEEAARKQALELVAQLGKLKGVAMKIGQMASYLPGSMPPAAQQVLARLQDSTEPMAPSVVEGQLRDELGSAPDQLFERFERAPFAAASIGQVHRARHGGAEVAVKVQYPGIEEVLRGDLRMAGAMLALMSTGTTVDGRGLADELALRILDECDYRREARNAQIFKKLIENEGRTVPSVIEERSARRVITTEMIDGQPFQRFAAEASQAERDRAGVAIFDASSRYLFANALFNADPHPGNYLFLPGGRVAFLDFGCARSFDAPMIERWKRFALSVLDGKREGFREGFVAMGFVRQGDRRFDWDAQWEATKFLYKPFLERNFRFDPSYLAQSYDVLMFKNPNKMRIAMPTEWLFLNRLQWGLFAVLSGLKAQGPWGDLWREYAESPTDPVAL